MRRSATAAEIDRVLRMLGFAIDRKGGDHFIYVKPGHRSHVTVQQ